MSSYHWFFMGLLFGIPVGALLVALVQINTFAKDLK